MLPKLLMNGIKLESKAPTQQQGLGAHQHVQDIPYKVKYGCKIGEKDEFGLCWLYFQNFHPFSPL